MSRQTVRETDLSLNQIRPQIDQRLTKLFKGLAGTAADIDPLFHDLMVEMSQFLMRGGKRMRPYLTYLAYVGLGGDADDILDVAISQELLHNFLLIHDDIIDRDQKRYGSLNISGRYAQTLAKQLGPVEARHFGEAVALLAGDLNASLANQIILDSNFSDELKLKSLQLLQTTVFGEAAGQLLDIWSPLLKQLSQEQLLKTLRYKTALYSFETPLKLGAIMAGANQPQLISIERFAVPLGIAFQIADDLLGMFGNENALGKPTLSDLREGKRTILIAHGLAMADPSGRRLIKSALGNPAVTYTQLGQVRTVLERSGAKAKTTAMANQFVAQAKRELAKIGFSDDVADQLTKLADFTVGRKS